MGKEDVCIHYGAERNTVFGALHRSAHARFGKTNTTRGRVVDGVLALATGAVLGTAILNQRWYGRLARGFIWTHVASQSLMHTSKVVSQCEYSESSLGEEEEEEEEEEKEE